MLGAARKYLSYSNVMATIAVFVALGGSAYAVGKLNGKNIKNRSIAAKKVKRNTLTGREVRESKLGKVPEASLADRVRSLGSVPTAIHADSAGNSDAVDGASVARLDYRATKVVSPDPPYSEIFNQGGLVLRARCGDQSGFFMNVKAETTVAGAQIHTFSSNDALNAVDHTEDDAFNPGDQLEIATPQLGDSDQGTFVYSTPQGAQVSVVWQSELYDALGTDCMFGGTAVIAPAA
jgi:hypothetical protein